ncbi:MAG: VWA domain-containing protein [Desulfamplus sp.]|nr:VWA domain-containing protein [Desulfamplus sp.]
MNGTITAPVLKSVEGGKIALQSVKVDAEIENLLCQVTVKQSYRNLEKINIEAVYTFPLPLDAVLLDMSINTRSRKLKGVVVEKSEAEDRYEDAITDGDTAIMLEQIEPGLYTMNVGNLQPEESIDISITYAELFKWQGSSIRFFFPTTVAPRYGDPESIGIQAHQVPEHDLTNENFFSMSLSISGMLSKAAIESPSHKIVFKTLDGHIVVTVQEGQAAMDRDFILNISMDADEKIAAHVEPDGDGYVALASFYPKFSFINHIEPRCITIVMDCSGSMGGDSIAQCRKALYQIIGLLREQDMFNIVCFGSTYHTLFPSPVPANSGNIKKAEALLLVLDANMGGTEIGQAIDAALEAEAPSHLSREILLITDGEVWDWEKVTTRVSKSGVRFFTVGVGNSVSESFVRTLADVTGGACELVSPNEAMAEKIVRHFKRIYLPKTGNVKINWPDQIQESFPKQVGAVYDGDTLHVFGRSEMRPEGSVELQADLENGETFLQRVHLVSMVDNQSPSGLPETTARMAAAYQMKGLQNSEEITALGVKYQLMSSCTNYLAIDVKSEGEKSKELPALRKTPQMLAAGWGGVGSVAQDSGIRFCRRAPVSVEQSVVQYSIVSQKTLEYNRLYGFIDRLNRVQTGFFKIVNGVTSIDDLKAQWAPDKLIEALEDLVNSVDEKEAVVIIFLYLLSQHEQVKKRLHRSTKRIQAKAYKKLSSIPVEIESKVKIIIENYFNTIEN